MKTATTFTLQSEKKERGRSRAIREGLTIPGSLEIFQSDVIPYSSVPCPLCFPVVVDRRGFPSLTLPILHLEMLSRFTLTHDLCADASIRSASRGRGPRDWPWEVILYPRLHQSFLENLYGSTIDLSRKGKSSLRRSV